MRTFFKMVFIGNMIVLVFSFIILALVQQPMPDDLGIYMDIYCHGNQTRYLLIYRNTTKTQVLCGLLNDPHYKGMYKVTMSSSLLNAFILVFPELSEDTATWICPQRFNILELDPTVENYTKFLDCMS